MTRFSYIPAALSLILVLTVLGTGCGADEPVARPVSVSQARTVEARPAQTPVARTDDETARKLDARFEEPKAVAEAPKAAAVQLQKARVEVAPKVTRLEVVSAKVGTAVEQRELRDARTEFDTWDGTLFAHVIVRNLEEPTTIKMVWRRDGELSSTVTLPVGVSPRWRTWSKKTLRGWDVGAWTVDVYDANDQLLETIEFDVNEVNLDGEEGC